MPTATLPTGDYPRQNRRARFNFGRKLQAISSAVFARGDYRGLSMLRFAVCAVFVALSVLALAAQKAANDGDEAAKAWLASHPRP